MLKSSDNRRFRKAERRKELCGQMIKCWDNTARPCVRQKGHEPTLGHNPFSDSPVAEAKPDKTLVYR